VRFLESSKPVSEDLAFPCKLQEMHGAMGVLDLSFLYGVLLDSIDSSGLSQPYPFRALPSGKRRKPLVLAS
jgi:hypothetical protein